MNIDKKATYITKKEPLFKSCIIMANYVPHAAMILKIICNYGVSNIKIIAF